MESEEQIRTQTKENNKGNPKRERERSDARYKKNPPQSHPKEGKSIKVSKQAKGQLNQPTIKIPTTTITSKNKGKQ